MAENRLNWKQILVTAIVTGAVTVITGIILFQFQTKEPRLIYSAVDTIPFQGPKENFAIYHTEIRNTGKKIVNNVICIVDVNPAIINKYKLTADASLKYTENSSNNIYKVELASLNPQESVTLSVLSNSKKTPPKRPKISLRGDGMMGIEESKKENSTQRSTIWTALIAAYAGVGVMYIILRRRFKGIFPFSIFYNTEEDEGDDIFHETAGQQGKIFAYLFELRGMLENAEEYLCKPEDAICYWSESDRIATIALKSDDKTEIENLKSILIDLIEYASIAEKSKGIVFYNIAKIAKHQGKADQSEEYLTKANEIIPKLLEKRIKLDPSFNINS